MSPASALKLCFIHNHVYRQVRPNSASNLYLIQNHIWVETLLDSRCLLNFAVQRDAHASMLHASAREVCVEGDEGLVRARNVLGVVDGCVHLRKGLV